MFVTASSTFSSHTIVRQLRLHTLVDYDRGCCIIGGISHALLGELDVGEATGSRTLFVSHTISLCMTADGACGIGN